MNKQVKNRAKMGRRRRTDHGANLFMYFFYYPCAERGSHCGSLYFRHIFSKCVYVPTIMKIGSIWHSLCHSCHSGFVAAFFFSSFVNGQNIVSDIPHCASRELSENSAHCDVILYRLCSKTVKT